MKKSNKNETNYQIINYVQLELFADFSDEKLNESFGKTINTLYNEKQDEQQSDSNRTGNEFSGSNTNVQQGSGNIDESTSIFDRDINDDKRKSSGNMDGDDQERGKSKILESRNQNDLGESLSGTLFDELFQTNDTSTIPTSDNESRRSSSKEDNGDGIVKRVFKKKEKIIFESVENFSCTEDFNYNQGNFSTPKQLDDNIEALRLLGNLKKERRGATYEEKLTLAKYAGWGGLKEILQNPEDIKSEPIARRIKEVHSILDELFTIKKMKY